jgi:Cd2+/Zn2+-exporting ATPase
VLIKGSATADVLANVSDVVFDKTGTLTTGDFSVTKITPAAGFAEADVMRFAAAAESGSNHPIAKAIVKNYVNVYGGKADMSANVRDIPGVGITAETAFGEITVKKADSGVDVFKDGAPVGNILAADTARETSKRAVAKLVKAKVSVHMLTGDRAQNAAATAKELGIADVRADLLPGGKVDALDEIKKAALGTVVFVGDGINDAPVLALADCGIAMGGLGQAAAVEAADAVIADDDPEKVVTAINLSKRTRSRAVQNIVFALAVKFIVLSLSALGLTGIEAAVFADVGVSVLAVCNAMRGGGK